MGEFMSNKQLVGKQANNKQRGITFLGFIIVLAVVGIFAFAAMRIVPMYVEYMAVKKAIDAEAMNYSGDNRPDLAGVRQSVMRRISTDYIDALKPEHITLVRQNDDILIRVKYEVRRPLIYNLDVIGAFDHRALVK